jgi:hypothetical protein
MLIVSTQIRDKDDPRRISKFSSEVFSEGKGRCRPDAADFIRRGPALPRPPPFRPPNGPMLRID